MHLDFRFYQAEERGAPHSFDIRRGLIDLQGRVYRWFTFRLQAELAGNPYLRNAWMDAGPFEWLHLRLGQMKVPFSSSWLTADNHVNLVERGTSTPIYPFFDRGVLIWGDLWDGAATYNLGAFTGAGIDIDTGEGDIDDSKDIAARFFLQPFHSTNLEILRGLYIAGQGTRGQMSTPTRRYETGGLRSANYESSIWRWRTEQLLGTDGRVTDSVSATVEYRSRWGAELHYLLRFFSLSVEFLECRFTGIEVYHDLFEGNSRLIHQKLYIENGVVRSLSGWISFYLTGENKNLSNWGWKTAKPNASIGQGGPGALEVLARYSWTWTDENLFHSVSVNGFNEDSPLLPEGYNANLPGSNNAVNVSILDGASNVHEWTFGLAWTLNPMVRVQLNNVFLWAPSEDRNNDGESDNKLVSGAKSNQSDPEKKNLKTSWENAVMCRLIFIL